MGSLTSISGKIIGKTEEHQVIKSNMEIDAKASLVCVPKKINTLLFSLGKDRTYSRGMKC